ncbi:MAG: sulfurtransferase [Acidimicrobiales bacterium]
MDAEELALRLNSGSPPTVLDARWRLGDAGTTARRGYEEGHIKGAAFVDLETDLAARPAPGAAGGRHPLPSGRQVGRAMRRAGVYNDIPVVCYDDTDSTGAARCWWILSYFGHREVHVLDGGLEAWVGRDRRLEAGEHLRGAGDFSPRSGGLPLLDAAGAAEVARNGVLLDARTGGRYRGEVEPVDPVAGHIPGAISAPTSENMTPERRWVPGAELRERFEALGVNDRCRVGAYCGSGIAAAHEVLALQLAGFSAAELYVGSWSEWCRDASRPVATGPLPGGRQLS